MKPHTQSTFLDELLIDNFAGGGGASRAIELALGLNVHHAFNHAWDALGMHRINHPRTVHHCEDIFDVDPAAIADGRPIGLAHFSPDCRHFSKAKGGKPVEKRIRGLCLVMLRYAALKARVMTMENVEEIVTWGPLKRIKKNGNWGWYPDERQKGRTWKAFLACLTTGIRANHPDLPEILTVLCGDETADEVKDDAVKVAAILGAKAKLKPELLRGYGYHCEAQILRACDYGAPTIRKRFFMVARRDGRPIVWPKPTHGNPALPGYATSGLKPWRTIAECIDWTIPCPSIFLDKDEARRVRCKRPLAQPTLRRIAKGMDRYVLKAKKPFIVSLTHQGGDRVEDIDQPGKTVTGAHRGEKAVVSPSLTKFHGSHDGRTDGDTRGQDIEGPLLSQDTSNRFGLTEASLAPVIVGAGGPVYSGKLTRVDVPFKSQLTENHSGVATAALAPIITEHANGSTQRNFAADEPLRTQCASVKGGHFAMVAGTLVNTSNGKFDDAPSRAISPEGPLPTVTSAPNHALACATLIQTGFGERKGQDPRALDPDKPLGTIMAGGGKAAVVTGTLIHTAHGEQDKAGNPRRGRGAHDLAESMPSVCASPDGALAAASMVKLRGTNIGDAVNTPLHTLSAGGQHHGLVTAHMTKFVTGSVGSDVQQPLPTITAGSHAEDTRGGAASTHGLVTASIVRHFGQSVGQSLDKPAPTVVAGGGGKTGLVAAVMAQHNGGFNQTDSRPVDEPISSICGTGSQQQLVTASLGVYYSSEKDGAPVSEPSPTVRANDHLGVIESTAVSSTVPPWLLPPLMLTPEQHAGALRVAAFLREYGVEFEGEYATIEGYVIIDIGMRMLVPRELYRAQGFPDDYVIDVAWIVNPQTGEIIEKALTKEQQVRMCGNSVSPPPMCALIRANVPELHVSHRWHPDTRVPCAPNAVLQY